jgi:hypothetical protein
MFDFINNDFWQRALVMIALLHCAVLIGIISSQRSQAGGAAMGSVVQLY